jgi:mono/diheme cytochrome c family protein
LFGGLLLLAGVASLAVAVACSTPTASAPQADAAPRATAAATQAAPAPAAPAAKAAPTTAASGAPKAVTKINIDEIFPPDEGRDLVLQNCVNCHTIVPIALARMSPGEWATHRQNHRPRVGGISDAEADRLWAYLTKHFGPDHQVPNLPQELLDTWTSY